MFSRPTRILLVVALVAAIAYILIGRREKDSTSDDASRLTSFDVSRVDHLILERPGETLRFVREDSVWQMSSPTLDTAEHSTIATLLDALEHAEIARNLGDPGDLSPYGLDAPAAVIKVLEGTDTLLVLEIGKRTVDEAWSYARRGDNEDLLLVPTGIARAASLSADAYRSWRLVDFKLDDIARYRLWTSEHETEWARGKHGWFTTVHHDTIRGDSVAVESMLRRLRGLRIAGHLIDPDDGPGPPPAGHITWWTTDGAPARTIHFTRGPDGAWRAEDPASNRLVVIEDDISDLFAHTTTSLRDRRLLQFPPQDAERIEVVLPGVSGAIVRRGGAWSFPNPALGRIDPEHAADFVRALRYLKWTDLAPKGAPPNLDQSPFSITITGASGNILDEMRADPHTDDLWYVTSRSSGGTRLIEGERLAALGASFVNLKQP